MDLSRNTKIDTDLGRLKERQRQIEKNQREGKAKVEASEALMRDGGPQQGSQSPGGSSGAGKSKEAKIGKPGSSGSGNTAGAARR